MSKRALVTGGAGFVGKKLVQLLSSQGWEVIAADVAQGDEVLACDIADAVSVQQLFHAQRPFTHVFHLAAMTFVPGASRNPAQAMNVNLLGTMHIAAAMQEHCPEARLIFVGSADAYGPPQYLPVDEDHPLQPQNPYAISKAACDHYCAWLAKTGALDVVRMRPFNHSGPGQSDHFVLSSFAKQIADIKAGRMAPEIHVGNLQAARDFSHVDDIIRAYCLAAEQGTSGAVYNVCSGNSILVQDALDELIARAGVQVEVVQDPDRYRPVDVAEVRGSHQRISEATGWHPAKTLSDLLQDLLTYWS